MATSDKEFQTKDGPVCHEKYSDPKILPCAYLLCRDCLVSWMKTKTEALCPRYSSDIVDPKQSSPDVFVVSLPTDHAMSVVVLKILGEKHVCHVHNNVDAISLCLYCNIKLCQVCSEVHRKLPSSSFHKVEDLATLTPERLAANRQAPCSDHPDKTAVLVCVDHNVLICQLCATAKHRTCSEVTYVSEVSGKYKQSLLEMENKLNAAESSLSQAITELEERLLKAEISTNAALAEIDTTCDSLLKSIETCRKRLKKLVTDENVKFKDVVNEQKNIISRNRQGVISHQGLIKLVRQTVNGETLVEMVRNLEGLDNDLNTSLPQDINSCLTVTLEIDRDEISLVEEKLKKIIQPIFKFTCGTGLEECDNRTLTTEGGSNESEMSTPGKSLEECDNRMLTTEGGSNESEISTPGKSLEECDNRMLTTEGGSNESAMSTSGKKRRVLLVIGKSGTGKSSTGNTILGNIYFKTAGGLKTETSKAQMCFNDEFEIIDTPDISLDMSEEQKEEEVKSWLKTASAIPNAVLLTINADENYSHEDVEIFERLKKLLERRNICENLVIVFTRGDLNSRLDLDKSLTHQGDPISVVLKAACDRYVIFDNKTEDKIKKREQVKILSEKIELTTKKEREQEAGTVLIQPITTCTNTERPVVPCGQQTAGQFTPPCNIIS